MSDDAFEEKVGYRRPPTRTRFKLGQSGNPRGRQKGVRNFGADVKRVLDIPVAVSDNGKARKVSTQEAVLMRLREKALKGDTRALDALLGLAKTHNSEDGGASVERPGMDAEDRAILNAYAEEIRSRAADASQPQAQRPKEGEESADG